MPPGMPPSFLFGNIRDRRADREIIRGDGKRIHERHLGDLERIDDAGFFEIVHILLVIALNPFHGFVSALPKFADHAIGRFAAVLNDRANRRFECSRKIAIAS